jgi:hypothetical protein
VSPETLMFTAKMLGTAIAVFMGICFFIGLIAGEEGGVVPLRLLDKAGSVDDQDLFAIATGNEEYLAAHCTLDPKVQIQNEKLEIQRLKNKYARIKVEQQIADLENKKRNDTAGTQTNPLIAECVNALMGLGENESKARAKVNKYFANNPNTKTIDEFIAGVFQR